MKVENLRNTTKIISNILHPYLILSLVVSAIAYQENHNLEIWTKWTLVTLSAAYAFPLIYMRVRTVIATRTTGNQVSFRSFFREQPVEMALLACVFGLPSAAILYFLDYPPTLIATLVGVAVTSLLIALLNQVYRASFHLALFTSAVIPLAVFFGLSSLLVIPLILLLGASRYYLGEHTPLQLLTGFMVGLMVTTAVFYGFGIL